MDSVPPLPDVLRPHLERLVDAVREYLAAAKPAADTAQLTEIRQHFERLPLQKTLVERQMVGVLFDEIDRLREDLETGFMQGAYARLKNLQRTERQLAEARGVLTTYEAAPGKPYLVKPFVAHHTGEHCIALWEGEPWLFWRHPDGQWVSECPVVDRLAANPEEPDES